MNIPTAKRIKLARIIAVTADFLQMGLFPLFGEGFASPLDVGVDVLVCGVMVWLVGWHFAFLPSFLMEGIPMVDLAPTWTIAVFIATRKKKSTVIDVQTERVKPELLGKR